MSKKGKLILSFCVSILACYLVRKLLIVLGMSLIGEIVTYLFLAVVGFIGINILVSEKYRKWSNLLPILCALIFLVIGVKTGIESHKENKEKKKAGNDTLMTLMEKSSKRAEEILTNIIVNRAVQELGLSQKKSGQTKKSYPRRTTGYQKKVVKKLPPSNWGLDMARSTPSPNSVINCAQTEARKAMQRVVNQGKRVKIE